VAALQTLGDHFLKTKKGRPKAPCHFKEIVVKD